MSGAFVVLLWRGWFPDLRQPGAESSRVAAAAILTAMLAGKIAARVRTAERRRSPRREAFSDAELGLLLLTAVYVLLAVSGGATSPVYPLVYAVVSFLVTFHRLAVGLPLAAAAIGFEAVICFSPRVAGDRDATWRRHFSDTPGSSRSSRCSTWSSCTPRSRASAASAGAAWRKRSCRCARRRATSA